MLSRRALFAVILFILAGSEVSRSQDHKVAVQVKLSHDKVAAGSTIHAMVIVEIHDGWHINSATPSDENQIESVVSIKAIDGIGIDTMRYPPGVLRDFGFSDVPLDVYEGSVNILVTLHAAEQTKPGKYLIPMSLAYQACNDNICLAPTSVTIDVPLEVVAAGEDGIPINQELFKSYLEENHR